MALIGLIIQYRCPCGYQQTDDPNDQQYNARMQSWLPGIPLGACPACFQGSNPERTRKISMMEPFTDQENPILKVIAEDTDLEARQAVAIGLDGKPLTEQVGETTQVVYTNGTPATETVPVYAPVFEPISDQALSELKQQRDSEMDNFESTVVSTPSSAPDNG